MKRHWTNEELTEHWTLSSKELDLIGDSKTDHNLLGAACLLKYFQYEGRFPAQKQDVPPIVIVHLSQQLGVVPEKIIPYDWEGRTIKAHRAAIRTFLGVHEATLSDEEAVVEWLCKKVLTEQRQEEALIASVYTHCKDERIDPPTPDRVRRLVHTAIHRFDERLCATIMQQLSLETPTQLDALLTVETPETQVREEELLKKYIDVPLTQPHFASSETVPLDEIVPATWRKAVCIYSQLKRCSSSEVAAMFTGLLRHASQMHHLSLPLLKLRGAQTRDSGRTQCRGELELGDQFYPFRSSRGIQCQQRGRSRAGHARTPPLADIPYIYPDLDDSRGLVGTGLDEPDDLRGLTPLIYSNVNPYGLMRLNMAERLTIERAEAV